MKKLLFFLALLPASCMTIDKPPNVEYLSTYKVTKIVYEKHDYLIVEGVGTGIVHSESCEFCRCGNRPKL